jgi:TatD DNase family protein
MQPDIKRLNLSKGMVDSHFHLYHMLYREMKAFDIIEHCFSKGLEYAVDIGINADNFKARIETAEKFSGLYTAHGYYPSECVNPDIEEKLSFLSDCLTIDPKAVALGEIGLDFFHDYGTAQQQRELFRKQLLLADKLNLPVIIHSREAEMETLEVLKEFSPAQKGIIHGS